MLIWIFIGRINVHEIQIDLCEFSEGDHPTKFSYWIQIWITLRYEIFSTTVVLCCGPLDSMVLVAERAGHVNRLHGPTAPSGPEPPLCRSFTITLRHTTLDRTPLDEWSARRRDLYLTTHNTHKRETSMTPAGFEPSIPAGERTQSHTLDRAVTVIGVYIRDLPWT